MNRLLDVGTSIAVTLSRFPSGGWVGASGQRPEQPLVIYEFEGCPFCRKVREALSILDLDASIRPCPKGGQRFRPELIERGGKAQFPYLIDPNTGKEMYESDAIVRYLFETYGEGAPPFQLRAPIIKDLGPQLASIWRPLSGVRHRASRIPEQPLELYSYELSPYSRLAREALCELELPYLLHNVARGSASREAFVARAGRMMVPYLVDPNTNTEMFESADIVAYLDVSYAL